MTYRMPACCYPLVVIILFTEPIIAGPPFKTDDPQPVDFRHWEFYIASQQQFDAHATNATLPHVEINYGIVPGVQLHVVAPVGFVRTDDGTQYGYADTEFGVKYRFIDEGASTPQVGIFPLIEVPTGNERKNLGAGSAQVFIPVWLQKSWGKWTTNGGGGMWYATGEGKRHWYFAGGEAQCDVSGTVTLGAEAYYQSPDTPDADATEGFALGGIINFSEHDHLLFSIGRTASSALVVTGYLGYQLTL